MQRSIHTVSSDKRIFFVGDIHGEITKLNDKLKEVGFNKGSDHLFSVGDLIDRGEDSLSCLDLTNKEWFSCVRGNHEQMAYDAVNGGSGDHVAHWMMNGGGWYAALDCDQKMLADDLIKNNIPKMPHVMEIHHKGRVIVVCHADWPLNEYSSDTVACEVDIVWSRSRIESIVKGSDRSEIRGADIFVFGHTPLKKPLVVGNQIWIDTGACFGKQLTVMEL